MFSSFTNPDANARRQHGSQGACQITRSFTRSSSPEWMDFILLNAPSVNMSFRGDMSENSLTWFADAKAWCNFWPRVID